MTTKVLFFKRFAPLAAICFTTLVLVFMAPELSAQNIDQLGKKMGTDFPANFLKMDRSGPMTIQVGVQDFMFEINQASGVPLYIQIDVEDSFGRDYSGLAGGSEFISEQDLSASGRVSFSIINSGSKTSRIGILELKDSPGGVFQVRVDGGKTTLCFPMGYETGEEELRKLVRLVRTKDGRLAAMVTFNDIAGIFKSLQPGIRERICMVLPLQENTPEKSLKLVKDKEGNLFALLLLRDGNSRVKASGSGKANFGITLLTPSDKQMAEKIGMTLVVVN
jgi:hypothetical protein